MAVRTSAGTTIALTATQPATYDAAGYAAAGMVYTPVGEVTDLGEFGREYALVTHSPVGNRATVKKKGSFNQGAMTLQLGLDNDDAGQTLLQTAAKSDADYSFKVTLQNNDVYYFQAQVMSFKTAIGGVDTITNATVTLELTSNSAGVGVVLVNAA